MNEPVTERKMSQFREGSLRRMLGNPEVLVVRKLNAWIE